ncbi:hypothetical protein N5094_01175 [Shewanella putrefaciens]|uniref:hypothetical protein n=1 Tax=Shewanella putrefaciens TaxID=24 RepID=UPI0021C24EB6|nr:hypothetical protein [Shewanella putrefaciens]UXK08889.1 hypothetical protein N5094_01175 [Shewanella putrefaciens]
MEKKIKHLEFIQSVITRISSNSFLVKGWTITLISALFALAAKDANIQYVLISYIIIPVFWVIDGFFISQERQYRKLYDEVRLKNESDIDFSMDASKFSNTHNSWISGIYSKTLFPFYGTTVIVTVLVMFFIS